MALEFTENLTIEIPAVEQQIAAFAENEYKKQHGLIVEVAAIHEGMTANYNFYPAHALESSLQSWVSPYPKPIIMNHDPYSEPVGRVMGAKMEKEADETPYVKLQVAITDPEAIQKIMDQRYLTGSVGGKAEEANCSVCGVDWAQASMTNLPCKHQRGKMYKGKLMYFEMNRLSFKEYSFVNMPADQRSNIRAIGTSTAESEPEEGWVKSASFFSLDMGKEEIVEFSESAEDHNVLAGLKKKQATPVYMNLKGAFLSAMALAEADRAEEAETNKESDVSDELINEEVEEDVLAVAEELSDDLATKPEEEAEEAEEVTEGEEEEAEEAVAEADAEEAEAEEAEEEAEEVSEGDKPEGQERPRTQDVDPETSEGAPVSREDDEEVLDASEEEEVEEQVEEPAVETELNEAMQALESRVEVLESENAALLEENTRLKAALKRNLAERVVDTKVALGIVKPEERDTELNEHVNRTAQSLADSLRDLSAMPGNVRPDYSGIPQVENESGAIDEEGEPTVLETDITESTDDDEPQVDKVEEGLYRLLNGTWNS